MLKTTKMNKVNNLFIYFFAKKRIIIIMWQMMWQWGGATGERSVAINTTLQLLVIYRLKAKRKSSWPTDMSLSNEVIQIQIPCYQIAT